MEKGTKVRVSAPYQYNYSLEGEVIQEGIALDGLIMSKVRFSEHNEVWYPDQNLKTVTVKHFDIVH